MKKIIAITLIALSMTACNRQIVDLTYSFDEAIIRLPNGSIVHGNVTSWKDYEDGDQVQVVIDGTTYLVHSSNIVLINK